MLWVHVESSSSSPEPSERLTPLDHFRAKTRRLKIHPTEVLLLWVVSVHLVFLPWALGGMRSWGQWTSLGLAAAGFVIALIPRGYTEEHTGAGAFRLIMWPRATRDSSKATTSAGRSLGRIIRHDSAGAGGAGARFGNGLEVRIATQWRERQKSSLPST